MDRFFLLLLLALSPLGTLGQATSTEDRAGIMIAVNHYFEGGSDADSNRLKQGFHSSARLQGVREGAYAEVPIATYISNVGKGKPGKRRLEVPLIDVTGMAAIAKLEIYSAEGKHVFTDYLQLLKLNGTWTIVNKSYHRH